MNSSRPTATVSKARLLFLVGLLLSVIVSAGCTTVLPTTIPIEPTLDSVRTNRTVTPAKATISRQVELRDPVVATDGLADATAVIQTALPDSGTIVAQTPVPEGGGVRPQEAQIYREPGGGLVSPLEWRPPPVEVPHSIHPDDHYWLARPIASDSRNYDLEWYHYGNQPMRSDALPYRVHHGLDFPNDTGTPIFATSNGTVVWAGNLPSSRDGVNYYGNTVIIKHDWLWLGENVYTLYAHTLELFVEEGDYVEEGQLIAGVGASGEVSGPHLHIEVRVGENNYQSTRNPALWLAPYEGWGTLAGRFIDQRGRLIHGAQVTVIPVEIDNDYDVSIQRQRTYEPSSINSDDVWQENFVVADLPAGEYRVVLSTAGETFRRTVFIRPGQTNYIIIQADFNWGPTETPTPLVTATTTLSPPGTQTPVE